MRTVKKVSKIVLREYLRSHSLFLKKVEFHFYHLKHYLQVLTKSAKGSGYEH
jgi:hypothetical protein